MIPPEHRLHRNAALEVAAGLLESPDTDNFYLGKELRSLAEKFDTSAPTPGAGAEAGPPATGGAPRVREGRRQNSPPPLLRGRQSGALGECRRRRVRSFILRERLGQFTCVRQ